MALHSVPPLRALATAVALFAAFATGGCQISALGQQPRTNVYVLSSLEEQGGARPAAAAPAGPAAIIGVATVGFPAYLERKDIVTRASDSRLVVHQFDKWGSSPEEEFTRAVAANLRVLLPYDRAVRPPFRPESPPDLEVRITVDRFERLADGQVALDAGWVIVRPPGARAIASDAAAIRIADVGEQIPAVVAAMSRAAIELSERIAADLAAAGRRPQV